MSSVEVLDRQAGQPLYRQLATILRREARAAPPGTRFFGDDQLCVMYGVSRPVVRAAVQILVDEGRVERQRGRGSFVRDPEVRVRPDGGTIAAVSPLGCYFPHVGALRGIREVVGRRDRDLLLHEIEGEGLDPRELRGLLGQLLERAAGVVYVSPVLRELPELPAVTADLARRVVFVNLFFAAPELTSVVADYRAGIVNAVAHLYGLGRRRIAWLGGPRDRLYARCRYEAYRDSRQWYDFTVPEDLTLPYAAVEADGGLYEHVCRGLRAGAQVDAIIAHTDTAAAIALRALHDCGRRVPEDVAVVGFDDAPVCRQQRPELTSVRAPYPELGQAATRVLLDQLSGDRTPGGKLLLPCPLVIRESTQPTEAN